MLLAIQIRPFLLGREREEGQLLLGCGERLEPPFKRSSDGACAGDHQTLHQDHQEADVAPLLPHGLVVAFADVFGDRLVEELLIAVSLFPRHRAKLRAPVLEQRLPIGINGVALLGANDMRLDPLSGDAADVRKLLGIDQGNQPVKGVGLALVRGGRKHQEIRRGLGESLTKLEAGHLVGAAAETVRLVHNHEVPSGGDQILEPLAVVLAHLGRGPSTALVQGLYRIHRHDHLGEHLPAVDGENLHLVVTFLAVSRARYRGDPFQCLDVLGKYELEGFPEVEAHLADPLAHQPLRGDDQRSLDQPAKLELPHDEPCLDGLAQADFIRQEIAHPVVGDGAG